MNFGIFLIAADVGTKAAEMRPEQARIWKHEGAMVGIGAGGYKSSKYIYLQCRYTADKPILIQKNLDDIRWYHFCVVLPTRGTFLKGIIMNSPEILSLARRCEGNCPFVLSGFVAPKGFAIFPSPELALSSSSSTKKAGRRRVFLFVSVRWEAK